MIVFSMCRLLLDAIQNGNKEVQADVRSVTREREWLPKTPQELCHRILYTAYMGVRGHSSTVTRDRAQKLTRDIGAYHINMRIDSIALTSFVLIGLIRHL
jgi:NAD+ synthase (glutamine-hydrolysing)